MKSSRRRGRPRLFRPKVDKGTEELQKKRLTFVNGGQNPSLAESLLGILYARELISRPQYDAGQTLREIRSKDMNPAWGILFVHTKVF